MAKSYAGGADLGRPVARNGRSPLGIPEVRTMGLVGDRTRTYVLLVI